MAEHGRRRRRRRQGAVTAEKPDSRRTAGATRVFSAAASRDPCVTLVAGGAVFRLTAPQPSHTPKVCFSHPPRGGTRTRQRPDGDQVVDVRPVGAPGDHLRWMRLELEGVEVWADEWRERCSTTIQAAGAYVIVVETVVPSRAAGLSSCYLADLSRRTAVSHLRRAPGSPPVFSQRVLSGMAGATHARACLLEHAAELQAFLDPDDDEALHVELSEQRARAAAEADRVAAPHRPLGQAAAPRRERKAYRRGRGDRDGARGGTRAGGLGAAGERSASSIGAGLRGTQRAAATRRSPGRGHALRRWPRRGRRGGAGRGGLGMGAVGDRDRGGRVDVERRRWRWLGVLRARRRGSAMSGGLVGSAVWGESPPSAAARRLWRAACSAVCATRVRAVRGRWRVVRREGAPRVRSSVVTGVLELAELLSVSRSTRA